jgi:hypothetical protein
VRLVYFRSLCGLFQVDGCVDANHLKLDLCRYYVRVYEMNLNRFWSFYHSIEYLGSSVARDAMSSASLSVGRPFWVKNSMFL